MGVNTRNMMAWSCALKSGFHNSDFVKQSIS